MAVSAYAPVTNGLDCCSTNWPTTSLAFAAPGQSSRVRGLLCIQGAGKSTREALIAGSRFNLFFSN